MTLLLTPGELHELTGTKQPKRQADWLKARGDQDVTDATMHSSERMVRQVYDRRRVSVAKPAG